MFLQVKVKSSQAANLLIRISEKINTGNEYHQKGQARHSKTRGILDVFRETIRTLETNDSMCRDMQTHMYTLGVRQGYTGDEPVGAAAGAKSPSNSAKLGSEAME